MNCYYCKGIDTVEEKLTRFCAYDVPDPFLMENVPASVCRLCGDKSYSGDVVTALEKIKNREVKPSNSQFFRVFDYCQLEVRPKLSPEESTLHTTSYPGLKGEATSSSKELKKHLMAYP